jgi:hypothetical protein
MGTAMARAVPQKVEADVADELHPSQVAHQSAKIDKCRAQVMMYGASSHSGRLWAVARVGDRSSPRRSRPSVIIGLLRLYAQ